MRALSALVLCLPPLILASVYSWRAYARLDSYRRASGDEVPFSLDTLQIALFDVLRLDARRMSMDPPPDPSTIDVYRFQIDRGDLDALERSADVEEDREYVNAKLELEGQPIDVELRLRGSRYWHTTLPQKSLKVKLEKGDLFKGHRVFNLINDPTPMIVGEHLLLSLARELGVLTPESDFARVKINSKDVGVFLYETQPDESLVRNARRFPGSVYSGDLPGSAKTEELWAGTGRWSKVASRNDTEEEKTNTEDLARFLDHVTSKSHREFARFAEQEMDLEAFAAFDVIDVAFGGDQHDYRQNHKYYLDPYRGRWEPVAWNFQAFRSDPRFNAVENPVLIRLKMLPAYLSLRDQRLYEFLVSKGTPAAVRQRGVELFVRLGPELSTDPHWDAYELLPRVDGFHRRMVRPLDLERAALVFDAELTTYRTRHTQLMRELEGNPLYLSRGNTQRRELPEAVVEASDTTPPQPVLGHETPLEIVIHGRAGVRLSALRLSFAEECTTRRWQLFRGDEPITAVERGKYGKLLSSPKLHPGLGLVKRQDPNERRGDVETQLLPANYSFTLRSSCEPKTVDAEGYHLATAARVLSRTASTQLIHRVPQMWASLDDVPRLVEGQLTPHPRAFEAPKPETIELGPGAVVIAETKVFEAHQSVRVQPGTELSLAKDASLIFHGSVDFAGTMDEPISVTGTDRSFGGIALRGKGTRGSRFEHVSISGGTAPHFGVIPFGGVLNVYDTSDITVTDCRFGENTGEGDALHAYSVDGLVINDTVFANTGADGLDLEFTNAELNRLEFVNMGDDALDLMGATVSIADSVIVGARGNGISAGEETRATVRNTLVADSRVGVLAKNASDVWLTGSILYRNGTGVRVYTRTVRYEGDSQVQANVLFAIESKEQSVKRHDRDRDTLDQGRVLENLPQVGVIEHLKENVLRLSSWRELGEWVDAKKRRAVL